MKYMLTRPANPDRIGEMLGIYVDIWGGGWVGDVPSAHASTVIDCGLSIEGARALISKLGGVVPEPQP